MKKTITAMLFGMAIALAAQAAHAGGFLADVFVRPWNPQLADDLDDVHEDLGNPLDQLGEEIQGEVEDTIPGLDLILPR